MAQYQSQLPLLARGYVRKVHDRAHDLPRYERVVVVMRLGQLASLLQHLHALDQAQDELEQDVG